MMNIKQAKARFTELTGYKATRLNFYRALTDKDITVRQWVDYRWSQDEYFTPIKDYRSTHQWVSIVNFFEALEEVA